MSIRLLASDLYRMTREVERREKALETAPPEQREVLSRELARARADRDRLRQALDGHKDHGIGAGAMTREK
jgi:hypothetical protein